MNSIDGMPGGRPRIADSSAALRPVATEGTASKGGTGTAFDDILSQVSGRDGVVEEPSAQSNRSDAATPASIYGAFSVNIAIAMQSDVAPPRSTLAVTDAAAEIIAAERAASAAAGDIGPRAAGADSPRDQTPDAASWIAKAAAGKAGIANTGSGVEVDSGVAAEPAAGGITSAALNLASPSFSSAPARDAGGVSARTKRPTETDAAPAAERGVNTSPSGSGEAASNLHSAAPFHTAVAGAPSPAFSGQAGVNFAADLASLSKSGPPARGAGWARPGGRLRSDGATPGSASDAAASQAPTQTTSQVGGGAPLFSLLLPAGAASIPEFDGAPLRTLVATPPTSDASLRSDAEPHAYDRHSGREPCPGPEPPRAERRCDGIFIDGIIVAFKRRARRDDRARSGQGRGSRPANALSAARPVFASRSDRQSNRGGDKPGRRWTRSGHRGRRDLGRRVLGWGRGSPVTGVVRDAGAAPATRARGTRRRQHQDASLGQSP